MKIGIFIGTHTPEVGGSFTFQNSIIAAIETLDIEHEIYVFGYSTLFNRNSKIMYIPLRRPNLLQRAILFLRFGWKQRFFCGILNAEVKKYSIDIIWFVTHEFEQVEIPYIGTVLDIEHRVHPFFPEVSYSGCSWDARETFFRTMVPRAAYIVCGTEAGKQQVVDFYQPNPDNVRIVPFFVPSFVGVQSSSKQDVLSKFGIERKYLFYPAQFWPHKNHLCLLLALKMLREKHHLDMVLVFSGSDKGNMSYIREQAYTLGVADRVIFTGYVTQDELAALYRHAFALVYASFFGPDNLPPMEAFASECPVVAAAVAGAEEQLGDAALLVDPRSEQEFCDAVMQLVNNPELREKLVQRGKNQVADLTPTVYVLKILSLVDEFESFRRCWSRTKKYTQE